MVAMMATGVVQRKRFGRPKLLISSIWHLLLITACLFGLGTTEITSDSKTVESISLAADAIGMYLRKIANQELFVSKMQDIFDQASPQSEEAASMQGMFYTKQIC